MPSFAIRASSVVGLRPRSSAAPLSPLTRHAVISSTSTICWRSCSSRLSTFGVERSFRPRPRGSPNWVASCECDLVLPCNRARTELLTSGRVNQRAREFERVGLGVRDQPYRLVSDPETATFQTESADEGGGRSQTPTGTRLCAIRPVNRPRGRGVNQKTPASSRRWRKLPETNPLHKTSRASAERARATARCKA